VYFYFPSLQEQDFEICATQLVTKTSHLIILSLYGAPSGKVNEFLRRSEAESTKDVICQSLLTFQREYKTP
jgi:hypothetical protein